MKKSLLVLALLVAAHALPGECPPAAAPAYYCQDAQMMVEFVDGTHMNVAVGAQAQVMTFHRTKSCAYVAKAPSGERLYFKVNGDVLLLVKEVTAYGQVQDISAAPYIFTPMQ